MNNKTFLLRPFDKLLIREDPIYKDQYFTLEKLNDDLSHDKDKVTSKEFPEAETPEQFMQAIVEDDELHQSDGYIIICKQVLRPGWIRIVAPANIDLEQLWKQAMEKVEDEDFYHPQFLTNKIKQRS